jgi:ureidoglycolate lyase
MTGDQPRGARRIRVEPLTAQGFAPFGEVISARGAEGRATNLGTATRIDWAARLESTRPMARPDLAMFRCAPQALPIVVRLLERHPHSTQAFLPLKGARWLVCVASDAADGLPDTAGLRAFVGRAGQGVNFRRGLWHHPMLALGEPAEFAMLAWEDGTAGDVEEHRLTEAVEVLDALPEAGAAGAG